MNWLKIKEESKDILKGNIMSFVPVVLLTLFLNFFTQKLNIETELGVTSLFLFIFIMISTTFINFITNLYYLKVVEDRSNINNYSILKPDSKYFKTIFNIILANFLMFIIIFFGMFLFIIPGIILSISYSFVLFIFVKYPDISPLNALKFSRELLDGYKADLFFFGLSFIGWIILSFLFFPIFWTGPYISLSYMIYFRELLDSERGQIILKKYL